MPALAARGHDSPHHHAQRATKAAHGNLNVHDTDVSEDLAKLRNDVNASELQSDEEAAAYVDKNGKRIQPDAKKGDLKFVDYDGDGTIGFGDRQYMGSATPKTTFAWTLGFTWKKLSFSAMFQGVCIFCVPKLLLAPVDDSLHLVVRNVECSASTAGTDRPLPSDFDIFSPFAVTQAEW